MGKKKAKHGRKFNQKMKPYLVYDFLLRNTDEDHVVDANDIIAYLSELGITAERRSIYSDIAEMNKILYLLAFLIRSYLLLLILRLILQLQL